MKSRQKREQGHTIHTNETGGANIPRATDGWTDKLIDSQTERQTDR